jgi:hypothetical protein
VRNRYIVLLGICALGAGIAFGNYFAHWRLEPALALARSAYGMGFADYIDVQHYEGTPEAYEAALTQYIQELNGNAKWPYDITPTSLLAFDQTLAYVRLSESQAKRGATQDAARSLASAEASCARFHFKGCDEASVLAIVKRLDERHGLKSRDCEARGR